MTESAYDPQALSRAGAMGLMQLMPGTAQRYGVSNAWDPVQNLDGGARYLRDLLKMFNQDLRLALAGYNAGEGAVQKYGNQIPPYRETQNYVVKVMDLMRQLGAEPVAMQPKPAPTPATPRSSLSKDEIDQMVRRLMVNAVADNPG